MPMSLKRLRLQLLYILIISSLLYYFYLPIISNIEMEKKFLSLFPCIFHYLFSCSGCYINLLHLYSISFNHFLFSHRILLQLYRIILHFFLYITTNFSLCTVYRKKILNHLIKGALCIWSPLIYFVKPHKLALF